MMLEPAAGSLWVGQTQEETASFALMSAVKYEASAGIQFI